jgi:hypothetical protein
MQSQSTCHNVLYGVTFPKFWPYLGLNKITALEFRLLCALQRAYAAASAVFEEVAVGEGEIRTAHERRLHDVLLSRFSDFKARRLAEAAAAVNDMLLRAHTELANVGAHTSEQCACSQARDGLMNTKAAIRHVASW